MRRAGPHASRRDVVFSHSTGAGPSSSETLGALFPTLVAIKKCKFILLLLLLFLPACKTILGHNGPTERQPRRAWELLGQGNTSWVGAGGTTNSNGLNAKEGQDSTQCPGEQERLLAAVSPSVLRYPSQKSLQKVLSWGGKSLKITLKPTLSPVSAQSKSWQGWMERGRQGVSGDQSHPPSRRSRVQKAPTPLSQVCGSKGNRGGRTPLCPPRAEGRDPTRDEAAPRPSASHGAAGLGRRPWAPDPPAGTGENLQGWRKAGD